MGFLQKLNWLIELYLSTIKSAWRYRLWIPFFSYLILQFILLVLLASYNRPEINSLLSPFISLAAGKDSPLFGHYPGLYLMLPMVFQWGKLALGVIFEGFVTGATSLLFLGVFAPSRGGQSAFKLSLRKWPQLLLAWTCITAILILLDWLLPSIFAGVIQGSPRRVVMFDIILRLFTVFIYSIFMYAVPAIMVYQTSIWGAFKSSFSFFGKYPIFSFFLALIPYLLSVPTTFLISKSDVIVDKFSPELVFYVLVAGIVADLLVNFITTGAVVKFLIDESE